MYLVLFLKRNTNTISIANGELLRSTAYVVNNNQRWHVIKFGNS